MQIGNHADTALSGQALADLKVLARKDPQKNATAVANQFESLLFGLILKESHKDHLGGKLFENHATELAQELLDQEVGLHVAQKSKLGFEEMLRQSVPHDAAEQSEGARRLPQNDRLLQQGMFPVNMQDVQRHMPSDHMPMPHAIKGQSPVGMLSQGQAWSRESFVAALQEPIAAVAAQLGVDSRALMAQAALESGWGRRILKLPDGQSSFNVFNIKADKSWNGPAVEAAAVEEEGGIAVLRTSRFRSYGSLQESIADYADFLRRNPRYSDALKQRDAAGYIAALAQAGYATDHSYVTKVLGVMEHPTIQSLRVPSAVDSALG